MRIFDYAFVTAWDGRLDQLKSLAEPERWTFKSVPDHSPLPILDSYVRYTFLRLHDQGKISETDGLACFNTGLMTRNQEEIFGLFRVFDHFDPAKPVGPDNKKWYLKGFVRAGESTLTAFMELPQLPTYWENPADLVFNPHLQVQLNLDHIISDNLNRFPVELGGQLGPDGKPLDISESPDIEDEVGEAGLMACDADDGEATDDEGSMPVDEGQHAIIVPLALRNALEGAMKHSVRLARRSYRMAVPQFYRGKIQLLLPLYLRNADVPDLALTLERCGEWYRAATVLYPDWAYRHARLLTRPNSEWLGGFKDGTV